jgi:hypothetical protein
VNELDLIRAFRATEGTPAAAAGDARADARRRLTAHIAPPERPRRRWLVPAGGLAVAAAAAVAIALTSGVEDRRVAPGDAAAALNQAADAAEQGRGLGVLGPGDYFYVRTRHAYPSTSVDGPEGTWSIVQPAETESWSARDASGRQIGRPHGRPSFPTPRDRERWIAAGRPAQGVPRTDQRVPAQANPWYLNDRAMSYRELLALPTDPAALRAHIREAAGDSGSSPDAETFTLIADMLRDNPVPSRLRAALYRALALVPGVTLRGELEDRLGRAGVGVSYDDEDGIRQLLIFDPRTAAVLEDRMTLLRERRLLGYRIVVDSGVVGSVRERP